MQKRKNNPKEKKIKKKITEKIQKKKVAKKEEIVKKKFLENEIDEVEIIDEIPFREFLQPLKKTAPVLEKVAVAQDFNLEQQLADVNLQHRENEQERVIKYGGSQVDYGVKSPTEKRSNFHYTDTPNVNYFSDKNKDEKKKPFPGMERRNEWGKEEGSWMIEERKGEDDAKYSGSSEYR